MVTHHFFPVRDIELSAVLYFLDCKLYEPCPLTRMVVDGREVCAYNYVPTEVTNNATKYWDDFEGLKDVQLPDLKTVVAISKFAFMNKSRMLDEIKKHAPLHRIERNGKVYLVTKK